MSKTARLKQLLLPSGKIAIAALDHRGSLKDNLHPENPEVTTDQEILAWKRRMIDLYKDRASGLLIDPIYGKNLIDTTMKPGWMLSMEKTGYRGGKEARVTEILENWSVAQAKEMGACSVKLLLYYDPENIELAKKQKEISLKISQDCEREGMVFLLEPLSYLVEGSREDEVIRMVKDLADIPFDIYKSEYPGTRRACEEISRMIKAPWVLLSAGMEYSQYCEALRVACESGASGFAVGRALWQEFGQYEGEARERYFCEVASPRMDELLEIVEKYGKEVEIA
ncbi:MAG: tagatose 1,6-diphosphate aldolase [Candidatus Microgenomates bacterium]